jgi:hypothetical protein
MAVFRVIYVKPDAHDENRRIQAIAGEDFHHSIDEAIAFIQNGVHEYWTFVGDRSVWLEVATRPNGVTYLRTQNDSSPPNDLLSLPEFG